MSMAGRMVRHARARARLTQRELAAKVGIPQETIARIESGRVDPRVGTLDRLLEGCGYGLEHAPRLGIGIDRTTISRLIELTPSERLELGVANDRAMVERWQVRRIAESGDE